MTTFLSAEEMAELTGIKTGRRINGKTVRREQLQSEWLRSAGIPFYINARGRPIVVRENMTGRAAPAEQPRSAWQPRALKVA